MTTARALYQLSPAHAIGVPLALGVCVALLIGGLSQPILYTQQLVFWKQTYSIWTGMLNLWDLRERFLAAVVFCFSIVFPFAKLALLTGLWYLKCTDERRVRIIHWLGTLGKWSMLDVFAVAILIVLVKIGSLAKIEPRPGIYWFGGAILASMLTTTYVARLVCRAARDGCAPCADHKVVTEK